MYISVGNNKGYGIKDAEVMDRVQDFFSKISFNLSNIEKVLGEIGFDFNTCFNAGTEEGITITIIADHHYVVGDKLSFVEIKERFIRFYELLKLTEIKTANDLFFLFVCIFKNVN